jgi:hypothetical protein
MHSTEKFQHELKATPATSRRADAGLNTIQRTVQKRLHSVCLIITRDLQPRPEPTLSYHHDWKGRTAEWCSSGKRCLPRRCRCPQCCPAAMTRLGPATRPEEVGGYHLRPRTTRAVIANHSIVVFCWLLQSWQDSCRGAAQGSPADWAYAPQKGTGSPRASNLVLWRWSTRR